MPIPRTILLLLLFFTCLQGIAQQQFYLYIQSTASQPFYARIQNNIYSSSENGYMIVPRLHDSTYEIFIGFARNAYPEQHFAVEMNKQDQGFELRNTGEKGWGLFSLQTGATIQNSTPAQKQETDNTGERKSDPFSQMLANVVNDSSILYTAAKPIATQPPRKTTAAPEPVKQAGPDTTGAISSPPPTQPPVEKAVVTDSVQTAKTVPPKKDSIAAAEKQIAVTEKQVAVTTPPAQEKTPSPIPKKEASEKPFITRIVEQKGEESYRAVYLEQYVLTTDTIDVEIPLKEGAQLVKQPPVQPPVTTQTVVDTTTVSKPAPAPVVADSAAKKKAAVVVTNSDCKNFASDSDLDKLRVKLIAENAVDDKLVVARKYFKTKCYSVQQIKALTELFPSDETKYRFFDVAYPFVSDSENFSLLETMIENDYYKNLFKAMIRR